MWGFFSFLGHQGCEREVSRGVGVHCQCTASGRPWNHLAQRRRPNRSGGHCHLRQRPLEQETLSSQPRFLTWWTLYMRGKSLLSFEYLLDIFLQHSSTGERTFILYSCMSNSNIFLFFSLTHKTLSLKWTCPCKRASGLWINPIVQKYKSKEQGGKPCFTYGPSTYDYVRKCIPI